MSTWRERLDQALKRGRFTAEDKTLIGEFCNCMVGERADVLGVISENRTPLTGVARQMGYDVATHVRGDDLMLAEMLYEDIQMLDLSHWGERPAR